MRLYWDNELVISIVQCSIQHDRTKQIELDRHFIKEKLNNGLICTRYMPNSSQFVGVLTRGSSSCISYDYC